MQTQDGTVQIVEQSCIECGLCVPACQHDAIDATGDLVAARKYLDGRAAVLILGTESVVHFHPATSEQVLNACYAAGFRAVYPGVLGDELVAHEYLRLWRDGLGRTTIRSTSPIVVEYVKRRYPELMPFMAPVVTPAVAQARYLHRIHGDGAKIVYCGIGNFGAPEAEEKPIDASITFAELECLLDEHGAAPLKQPLQLERETVGRQRYLSTAGGMPLPVLEEERGNSRRFRKVRGLEEVSAIAEAVERSSGEPQLGFIDLLVYERDLDHPVMGPKAQLYLRREIAAESEPPRSSIPVIDVKQPIDLSTDRQPAGNGGEVTETDIEALIDQKIGRANDGKDWDCGACGFTGCRTFAAAVLRARARLDICPFFQARRYETAVQEAAYDALTQLYSYRVLRSRILEECARVRRTGGKFVVVFLDLDHFKPVNDRLGHAAGNQVLRDVAQVIRDSIRANDFAARFGGDEFVIILPDGDKDGALRVASEIRARVAEVRAKGDDETEMSVSVSVGIAEVGPGESLTAGYDEMLAAADQALLEAKRSGGDAIRIAN